MNPKPVKAPVVYGVAVSLSLLMALTGGSGWSMAGYVSLVVWVLLAVVHFEISGATGVRWRGGVEEGVLLVKGARTAKPSLQPLPKNSAPANVR